MDWKELLVGVLAYLLLGIIAGIIVTGIFWR
jgi:hypothetical protein